MILKKTRIERNGKSLKRQMNQEIQNNFIVEPFKASLIMGKILNFYKKMSVEDAICAFCLLGFGLMIFAIAGIFGRFLAEWISVWLFFSGVVVSAVAVIILFGKNDCFIHDISTDKN